MKLIILYLFLTISADSFCQKGFEFKKYVNVELIGQKQTDTDPDSTIFETTYLGQLDMQTEGFDSKLVTYHVIAQFYTVQAAIVRHGHSRIIFADNKGETVRVYILDMPEELPTSITNNALTFQKQTKRYLSLPDLFCVPDGGCYE